MKNLKNMFAWITLAVILTVGTVGANAGIIVVGSEADQQCTEDTGVVDDVLGIIVSSLTGVLVGDSPCDTGIMIAD